MNITDIINTTGVSLILLAFFLLTFGKMKATDTLYLCMNLVGAGLACYGSWMVGVLPFVILEGTWALVAAVGLIRKLRK